jgi:hypothetical protein
VAFFRFEHTIPAAFWRHELVYSDHSGYRNHLRFEETNATTLLSVNALDGNPQSAACLSDTGSGCTFLAYDGGYDTDKFPRQDWVAYDGVYGASEAVPPEHMFNLPAAPKAYQYTVRESLYDVHYDTVTAGGGIASFDAGETYDVDPAASLVYVSDSTSGVSKLSFTDDFTVEGVGFEPPNPRNPNLNPHLNPQPEKKKKHPREPETAGTRTCYLPPLTTRTLAALTPYPYCPYPVPLLPVPLLLVRTLTTRALLPLP